MIWPKGYNLQTPVWCSYIIAKLLVYMNQSFLICQNKVIMLILKSCCEIINICKIPGKLPAREKALSKRHLLSFLNETCCHSYNVISSHEKMLTLSDPERLEGAGQKYNAEL